MKKQVCEKGEKCRVHDRVESASLEGLIIFAFYHHLYPFVMADPALYLKSLIAKLHPEGQPPLWGDFIQS